MSWVLDISTYIKSKKRKEPETPQRKIDFNTACCSLAEVDIKKCLLKPQFYF